MVVESGVLVHFPAGIRNFDNEYNCTTWIMGKQKTAPFGAFAI